MNCYQAKANELTKQWFVIDATEVVVGRLAAQIAPILMGKHRPTYTPHIDTGDYVIVTNVDKVVFTGNKWQQKFYQRYSGHPGGQVDEQAWKLFQRHPDRILKLAIQRMMPKNKIGRHMMAKLKLCVGPVHEHQAQAPIPLKAVEGRPSAAGILLAPKVVVGPRKSRRKPAAPKVIAAGPEAATTEAMLPAPAEAHEAQLPSPADVAAETHASHAEMPAAEPVPGSLVEHEPKVEPAAEHEHGTEPKAE